MELRFINNKAFIKFIYRAPALILLPIMILGFSLDICDRVNSHDKQMASIKSPAPTTEQEDPKAKADERNGRWEEYKIHVELYKYYLDLVLKTNIAVFAILGAILTFYFTNKGKNDYLKKALYLPLVLTLSLGGFYIYSACLWGSVSETVNDLRERLGIFATPYVHILSVLLVLFGLVFLGIGDFLLWFIWTDKFEKKDSPDTSVTPASGSATSDPKEDALRSA